MDKGVEVTMMVLIVNNHGDCGGGGDLSVPGILDGQVGRGFEDDVQEDVGDVMRTIANS